MQSVANTIKKYSLINKGDVIGCAVSGGSDSMCLLHYLLKQSQNIGFKVICLNVEHGIRGESSKNDSQFVKDFCQKNNIELIFKPLDVLSYCETFGYSVEQGARILRYKFFEEVISSGKCNFVATGHHKSDNVESILMHIFRGSGLNGLTGIKPKSQNGYIRPLINTSKQEILDYLHQNNISFISDESNFDNVYRRNNLRNSIMPLIKEGFDGAEDNILRLSNIASQENELLDSLALKEITELNDGVKISLKAERTLIMRSLMLGCKMLGVDKDISYINISDAADLTNLEAGASVNLANNVTAYKDYDGIFLSRNFSELKEKDYLSLGSRLKAKTDFNVSFLDYDISFQLINKQEFQAVQDKFTRHKVEYGLPNSATLYVDADKLFGEIVIRTRRSSDFIRRINSGKKLISDYLTDIKLARRYRDSVPLICSAEEVLVVLPLEVGETVKISNNINNIYRIKFNKRGN